MEREVGVKETSRAPRRYRATSGGRSGGRRVRISGGYLFTLEGGTRLAAKEEKSAL